MADNPTVLLETSSGDILVELFPEQAPKTVANFLQYVDDGFYTNTIFHRVIPGFMIQGGGLSARMDEKPTRERHPGHGPHPRPAQRHRPVLHQPGGQ